MCSDVFVKNIYSLSHHYPAIPKKNLSAVVPQFVSGHIYSQMQNKYEKPFLSFFIYLFTVRDFSLKTDEIYFSTRLFTNFSTIN